MTGKAFDHHSFTIAAIDNGDETSVEIQVPQGDTLHTVAMPGEYAWDICDVAEATAADRSRTHSTHLDADRRSLRLQMKRRIACDEFGPGLPSGRDSFAKADVTGDVRRH